MIGQNLSHYKILEKLAEGGMGVVYKAQDTKLNRPVALKVLPRQALITEEDKTRFAREAQAAASLSHPNIATIFEFDEVDDPVTGGKLAFIAMEYVEGQTLKEKIQERPLPVEEAVKIATSVAEGLQEAHEKGIVHRDIKSATIMVTPKGQVKIMDFGLAEIAGRSRVTKEGMTVGTTAYMSPEQALGEKVDQRTDIWSLGVVLYEMITGRLPFAGDYEQAIVYRILNEEPEPITSLRSNVPMELERIVKKAMQKDRAIRYQSASDLLADLKGLRKELESGGTAEAPRRKVGIPKRRVYLYGGLVGFAAMVAVAALYLFPGKVEVIDSLAVHPLENLSRDAEQEYFVDGMHEALITELSKISALKVISRTSTVRYKGTDKPLPQVARELGVRGVIEGSVLREGDQVRITVQLIHGPTDRHLWAENYQRELRGILALHSEVARAIARQVRATLAPQDRIRLARARPVDPDVYELYLRGRYHWNQRTPESLHKALDHFQEAVAKDSAYGSAYAGVADTYLTLYDYGLLSAQESTPPAKTAARKAIELDPGYTLAYHWYSLFFTAIDQLEAAVAAMEKAHELDPLSLRINADLGMAYLAARQADRAIAQETRTLELDPDFHVAYWIRGMAYEQKGMYDQAIRDFQEALRRSPGNPNYLAALAHAHAVAGRKQEARKLLAQMKASTEKAPPFFLALVYAGLGDTSLALGALEKAYQERSGSMRYLKVEPRLDPLRDDPRFQALLRRMNFPEK